MVDKIRIAGIKQDSIVDGEGFRDVVFVSGCWWLCPSCHNPETHDKNYGELLEIKEVVNTLLENGNQITISGGDPLTYQLKETYELLCQIKTRNPNINIWLYTGFKLEDILNGDNDLRKETIAMCDVVVDGQFLEELKNINLLFRGSSNQQIWRKNSQREWYCE